MIRYNIIDGSLPEGCRIVSDRGTMKLGGVFPLDPSLNPPEYTTPAGRIAVIDELEPFSFEIGVSSVAGKTLEGADIVNGTLPWGLVLAGTTISGTPDELLNRDPVGFLPEDAPKWNSRDGLLATFGEYESVNLQLSATPKDDRTLTFSLVEGALPWGVVLLGGGAIEGQTEEVDGPPEPAGPGPIWDTARGLLGIFKEFENVSLDLNAIPRTGPNVSYRITKGALPWGLDLSLNTGNIRGTTDELMDGGPVEDDAWKFRPSIASRSYSSKVEVPFSSILNPIIPQGRTLLDIKVSGGFLPRGIVLNGTQLAGLPEEIGISTFSIVVTDSAFVTSEPTTFTFEVTA